MYPIQFGVNLVLLDKNKINTVMNFNKFTNLTKNVWRLDDNDNESNNLIYTLNKNHKKLYLVEILTSTHTN